MSDQQNLLRQVLGELAACGARCIGTWHEDDDTKHHEFDMYAANGRLILLMRRYGLDDGALEYLGVFRPVTNRNSRGALLAGIREQLTP